MGYNNEIAITSRKLENGDGMTTFVADIYIYILFALKN